jgi:hypothetical protein
METQLTKNIKMSLRTYAPAMRSQMRTVRFAEEVDVGTGYVDVIRFEDYVESVNQVNHCSWNENQREKMCKKIPCEECHYYVQGANEYVTGILTTCYEIKITKQDFKSKHGHNFVGNHNYYVIPKELYKDVEELVPEDIGIILYNHMGSLRKKKECVEKEVAPEDLARYLYNALKKWVDAPWKMVDKHSWKFHCYMDNL